jgi:hypothetical protein
MNSNPTGYQQHANPGYPVQPGAGQQFSFYGTANANAHPSAYPQPRPGAMQQQHSFNPMQLQSSGAVMGTMAGKSIYCTGLVLLISCCV